MKRLQLQSEVIEALGGIAAEGIRNQLGRPRMHRLETLVRESVQNSWDARLERSVVRYGISCYTADADQAETLRDAVFGEDAPGLDSGALRSPNTLKFLVVYDRGTVGLGGPTRANVSPQPGERADFVKFLRFLGQPPRLEFGGGTYGYGKAAFYNVSSLHRIVVHTHCLAGGSPETRLMASALGPQCDRISGGESLRYTGRHWWGELGSDGIVDPVIGDSADEMARGLGLPGFDADGYGTTILIPAPDFGGLDDRGAMELLRNAILRYFWPKQCDGADGSETMSFELSLEGRQLKVPSVEDTPGLAMYADLFAATMDRPGAQSPPLGGATYLIECRRPVQPLGTLALGRYPASVEVGLGSESIAESEEAGVSIGSEGSHHVALLRGPNFVVRYLPGPPLPYDGVQYAGVFRVLAEVDDVFAEAEPPTHDDWVPDSLAQRRARTFVKTCLRRIRERVRDFAAPRLETEVEASELPLGAFANTLGGLIAGVAGSGALTVPGRTDRSRKQGEAEDREKRAKPGGSGTKVPRPRLVGEGRIDLIDGRPALLLEFEVAGSSEEPVVVSAKPRVVLDGGLRESEPPAGSDVPRVVKWEGPTGPREAGPECLIPPGEAGTWKVGVSIPDDALVEVELSARRPSNS